MRILRLHLDDTSMIEFHPNISVAFGLGPEHRRAVREAFVAAVAGRAPRRGLIEAHDIVMDLDEDSLGLLDLDEVTAGVVVTADDLPGTGTSDLARQLRAAQRRLDLLEQSRRDAEQRVRLADAAIDVATAALEAAREGDEPVEHESAEEAHDALDEQAAAIVAAEDAAAALAPPAAAAAGALARARRELEEAVAETEAIDALVAEHEAEEADLRTQRAEVVGRLTDDAEAAVTAAREALARAEAAERRPAPSTDDEPEDPGAALRPDADAGEAGEPEGREAGSQTDTTDAAERRSALQEQATELRTALALQESFDPLAVRSALDAARAGSAVTTMVASPEALGLADRLEALDRRIDADADVEAPAEEELAEARRAVAEAEEVFERLEAELRGPTLTPERRAELEGVHGRILELEEELESARLRKGRLRSEIDAARSEERRLLELGGFRSFTDYLTGGPTAELSPEQADELQRARIAVLAAEAAAADLEDRVARRRAVDDAVADRDDLRRAARALLGDDAGEIPDAGLIDALASHRVEADRSDVVRPLRMALEDAGLRVNGLGLSDGEVLHMAADWLDEHQRGEEERATRQDRLDEIEAELAALGPAEDEAAADGATSAASDDDDEAEVIVDDDASMEPFDLLGTLPFADAEPDGAEDAPADDVAPDLVQELGGVDASDDVEATTSPELESLRDAVAEAERALEADTAARLELDAIDADLERLARTRPVAPDDATLARLRGQVAEAEQAHDEAEAARVEAESEMLRLRAVHRTTAASHDGAEAAPPAAGAVDDELVATCERQLAEAEAAAVAAQTELEDVRRRHDGAIGEVASLQQALESEVVEPVPVDEIEFYLLARLAAVREVCFGGSVPLVLDGALDEMANDRDLTAILTRLERMAGAVQVVHLTDDERIVDWATSLSERRAVVVAPQATATA